MNRFLMGGYSSTDDLKQKRQIYPDLVKGVAIILVIIGHNIQFGSGTEYYTNESYFFNPVFRFIYSFHMPLFMLVSGYFFYYSTIKYSFKVNVVHKLKAILVPIIVWSFIPISVLILKSHSIDLSVFTQIISTVVHNLWFLWAILFSSFVTLIVHRIFKDNIWVYIGTLIILLFIPDKLNFNYYSFMYPFFWV